MTPEPSKDFPWWLVAVVAAGLFLFWEVLSSPLYFDILRTLSKGIWITALVAVVAYAFACARGLLGLDPVRPREFSLLWRAVIALTLAYSAFLAEVFRAGLQSVEQGQVEAGMSLGLGRWHCFRLVTFPQAFRTIFPALGNDFVAMVKDSSLVSVLGVTDVTQLGKVTAAGNFRYFETYNVVALIYLTMTIGLSLVLRRLEVRLRARG